LKPSRRGENRPTGRGTPPDSSNLGRGAPFRYRAMVHGELRNLIAERGDQLLLCSLAHVGRANCVHRPVIRLPVRDEGSDADDGVVDMLRELVADRFTNFYVRLADEVVGGRKPAEVVRSWDTRTLSDRLERDA
jgi:hypothetical protein